MAASRHEAISINLNQLVPMTIHEALACAVAPIRSPGPPSTRPVLDRRDASVLLAHVLGRDRPWLLAHPEAVLTATEQSTYLAALEARRAHKPLQYITGHQEFYGLDLQVSPDTLIPRPETELLVEAVLDWAGTLQAASPALHLVDVGTGTGAIALALAANLPGCLVEALDLSPAVRPIIDANSHKHALSDHVRFRESDLLSALQPELAAGLRFDAVVSNPPYIPESDAPTLQPEVRDFEPHTALFAGPEGLDIYRRLIPQAHAALRPGGLLAMEFGFGQQPALAELLRDWIDVRFLDDLAGIPRVALASRP